MLLAVRNAELGKRSLQPCVMAIAWTGMAIAWAWMVTAWSAMATAWCAMESAGGATCALLATGPSRSWIAAATLNAVTVSAAHVFPEGAIARASAAEEPRASGAAAGVMPTATHCGPC